MCVELLSATPIDMFPYSTHVSMPYTEAQWIPNSMASGPRLPNVFLLTMLKSYVPGSEYDSSAYTAPANLNSQRRAPGIEVSSVPQHMLGMDRSKASSNAYGNEDDDMPHYQQSEQARAPRYNDTNMNTYSYQPASNLPLSPPTSSTPYLGQDLIRGQLAGSTSPASRADPVPIAPNPSGLTHPQTYGRTRDDEEPTQFSDTRKRKRTESTPERPPELTEEEKLLLKLKEEENLPWKDIAMRFQQELGKTYQVPALQMRFKRLRERIRQWTDNDIQALEQAFEYWEKHQFEIIATKMLDFGCPERFPTKAVQRKWEELHADRFAAPQQPFLLGHPDSTSPYAGASYPGPHGLFAAQQHDFVRHLSVGPGGPPGISPFPSPNAHHEQFIFGQQPAAATSLLSPAPVSLAGSATASVYGTSPLLPTNGSIPGANLPTGGRGSSSTKFAAVPGSYVRSTSIPTPRSTAGSPGPFSAPDDAASMAVPGSTSINEIGGVNMGLGLGLDMAPSPHQPQHHVQQQQTQYRGGSGRQRSFSSMQ